MTPSDKLRAARRVPDRDARIVIMAETMSHAAAGPDGACRWNDLRAAGFTDAEIRAYADDARALLSGRPRDAVLAPPGRIEGLVLVKKARLVRRRIRDRARRAAQQTAGTAA